MRYLNVRIDWNRLERFDDDDATATYNEDEIKALPEISDLNDPVQAAIALNAVSRTLVFDDMAACTGGGAEGAEAGEEVSDKDARGQHLQLARCSGREQGSHLALL
ncbi:hypothetical protein MRX96_009348 [Rhipicephalus microplus]